MASVKNRLIKFIPGIFFLLFGCAPVATSLPKGTDYDLSARDTLEKFIKAHHIKDTFKAIARIEINDGKKYPIKVAMMLKRPSLMRIESIPFFGPPDLFLSMNNDTLKVFLPGKNEFYLGRPSRENFGLFFPVNLSPADALSIMMGIPPIPDVKLRWKESVEGEKLRADFFSDDQKVLTLSMDRNNGRLKEIVILASDGKILHTVYYDDYCMVENIDLPQQITILSPGKNSTIIVRYSDMEFSKEGDNALFDLPIPVDVRAIIMDRK
ncbi:MAG TPA: DUF4292 domain-containing protein [Syntrophales bacterium]|nr:DUF4292 domain-containing protein [Syntrophales bacterium]